MHSVGFFDVGYVKTFEIEHYDSTGGQWGTHYSETVEGKGPGWWVAGLLGPWGA